MSSTRIGGFAYWQFNWFNFITIGHFATHYDGIAIIVRGVFTVIYVDMLSILSAITRCRRLGIKVNWMRKLPVISSIRTALYYTYVNIGLIAKVAAPWIGLYAIYTLVFSWFGIEEYLYLQKAVAFVTEFPRDARSMGYDRLEVLLPKLATITADLGWLIQVHDVFDKIILIVAYGSVAVAMHRSFMSDADLPLIGLGKRELKYILYMIVYMAVIGGLGWLFISQFITADTGGAIKGIIYVLIGLALLFILSRFLLVFPATAMNDAAMNPFKSWALTRGNWWALYGGILLVILSSLPISIFKVTVAKIALPMAIIWPAQLLLSIIVLTFILVFLSIVYRFLTSSAKQESQAPLY